jgi:mannan endo-1,4-beta-mannosidase
MIGLRRGSRDVSHGYRPSRLRGAAWSVLALGTQLISAVPGPVSANEVDTAARDDNFVTRRGTEFYLHGEPFRVAGVNNHYLPWGSKQEVIRVLDDAVAMKANVVRTFIAPVIGSPDGAVRTIWNWKSNADSSNLGVNGAYMASWNPATQSILVNDGPEGLQRVDFVLQEASKRKLHLIIAFLDFWSYTGGAPQMNSWHGGPNDDHFFASDAGTQADYQTLVRAVLTRTNSLTGIEYQDDPTIFAWELMNEPDIHPVALFQSWIEKMAAYVKSLDHHHMLASGHSSMRTNLLELQIANIDFGTWHGYPAYEKIDAQTFDTLITDYCERAKSFGKPVILEEFGVAQSNPDRPEIYRKWLLDIAANRDCAGWMVWRIVSRQDDNEFPADEHDQFDIHNDDSPVWRVLESAADAMISTDRRDHSMQDRQEEKP